MTARPKPTLVAVEQPPEPPIDIYASIKAKRQSIDWGRMHCISDKRAPVELRDSPRRGWLA